MKTQKINSKVKSNRVVASSSKKSKPDFISTLLSHSWEQYKRNKGLVYK